MREKMGESRPVSDFERDHHVVAGVDLADAAALKKHDTKHKHVSSVTTEPCRERSSTSLRRTDHDLPWLEQLRHVRVGGRRVAKLSRTFAL